MKTIGKIIIGWFGGSYEDAGLFDSKEDAEIGQCCSNRLHEIFSEYEGKKIKVVIEIME